MIERRDQMDSVGNQAYRPRSAFGLAFGLVLGLTLAVIQPSVGTAASATFEFMDLHPGMTLNQVEHALEQQGLNSPKLSRAPSFDQKAALARNERVSPSEYKGVQTLRVENGDNKVQIQFVAMPEGPVAAKITVEVFGGADADALSEKFVSQYGPPGRKTDREWLWGDTAAYFYARKDAYLEFQPNPASTGLPKPVAAIVLADPGLEKRSKQAIADEAGKGN